MLAAECLAAWRPATSCQIPFEQNHLSSRCQSSLFYSQRYKTNVSIMTATCSLSTNTAHQHQMEQATVGAAQAESNASPEAQLRQLEEHYVHNVYDAIAPHFHATRFAIWPKVMAAMEASCRYSRSAPVAVRLG